MCLCYRAHNIRYWKLPTGVFAIFILFIHTERYHSHRSLGRLFQPTPLLDRRKPVYYLGSSGQITDRNLDSGISSPLISNRYPRNWHITLPHTFREEKDAFVLSCNRDSTLNILNPVFGNAVTNYLPQYCLNVNRNTTHDPRRKCFQRAWRFLPTSNLPGFPSREVDSDCHPNTPPQRSPWPSPPTIPGSYL